MLDVRGKFVMRTWIRLLSIATALVLSACVAPTRVIVRQAPAAPAPAPAELVAYPAQGQTAEQADRDRYECHNWAVKQTGFDPSQPGLAPQYRMRVVQAAPPPGSNVLAGGVIGAMLGATVSNPQNAGVGALVGAVAGATLGAVADESQNEANRQAREHVEAQVAADNATIHARASSYRRAISACLEGRGYTVK